MSIVLRRYMPLVITAILGFFMILSYPIDNPAITGISADLGKWVMILASFGLGIGAINMFLVHGHAIARMEKGRWIPSIALLGSLILTTVLGLTTGIESDQYTSLYDLLVGAGRLTFTSLRGFFMFSAFYRAFRARTWEGGIMLGGTLLVMMYQVPIAELFYPPLNVFTKWLLDVPFAGGNRAITIVGGIAMIIMAIRMISGIDKTWMGRGE